MEGGRENMIHLVKWEVASRPKSLGGLGVGHLKDRNVVLLSKWLWRFSNEKWSFWHSIISVKYGCHSNGWDANLSSISSMSLTWKNIISLFHRITPHLRFVVGNGSSIHFWEDMCLFQIP